MTHATSDRQVAGLGDLTVTSFLVVSDQDAARDWFERVLGAVATRERDPVILQLAGSTLILNSGGPPTPDKPGVTLDVPTPDASVSSFLNLRVADIRQVYDHTRAQGAEWLTPPQDRQAEVRGFIRHPDGHLIEVGQSK